MLSTLVTLAGLEPTTYGLQAIEYAVSICRAPYRTRTGKPSPWQGDILPIELMAHKNDGFFLPVPPTKTVELGRMFYL